METLRAVEQAFAAWLGDELGHPAGHDVVAAVGASRRDLLRRRGESRPDRVVTSLDPGDVDLLMAQAWARAEATGTDRSAETAATCALWRRYVSFLRARGRWTGAEDRTVDDLLRRPPRDGLLGRGAHTLRTPPTAELARLQRTRLVRDAEDVLRGRAPGDAGLRGVLTDLGLLRATGERGPRWASWDSHVAAHAAQARRRIVVAEVVRVVRADPAAGYVLALSTSAEPADVALGGRLLRDLVTDGRLAPLVAGEVLPDRIPWRIARGAQPAVHVGLTRLADDGLLEGAAVGGLALAG
ncbi:hypothetical protein [Kineococcus sp. SYSU DK003]|uniref:hypothetical protein n=1 Tax=Kineococcus sp. SYSU DK003 TaxID=3383124 RepID=UPI003D7D9261